MESLSTGQSSLGLIAHTALDYLRLLLLFFICISSSNELKMATRNAVFFFSL